MNAFLVEQTRAWGMFATLGRVPSEKLEACHSNGSRVIIPPKFQEKQLAEDALFGQGSAEEAGNFRSVSPYYAYIWHIFDKPKKFANDFNYELSYVAVIRTGQPSPHWLLADPRDPLCPRSWHHASVWKSLVGVAVPMSLCLMAIINAILFLGGYVSNVFFIVTPKIGEMIQFDEHIFQMGWFNHHLV